MKKFNSFDKSIQFTIDRFEDGIAHYPDIKINGSETNLYYNTTHKQYSKCCYQDNFNFFYEKILNVQKRKSRQNQPTKQKQANKKH